MKRIGLFIGAIVLGALTVFTISNVVDAQNRVCTCFGCACDDGHPCVCPQRVCDKNDCKCGKAKKPTAPKCPNCIGDIP